MEVEVQPHGSPQPPPASPELEPHLLVDWKADNTRPPLSVTAIGSILIHLLVFLVVWLAPALPEAARTPFERETVDVSKAVPLTLPPELLTQRAANKKAVSKELDLAGLVAKPDVVKNPTPPAAPIEAPASRKFEPPPVPAAKNQPSKAIDPSKVEPAPALQAQTPPAIGTAAQPLSIGVPPPPPPSEKPKLAFETPGQQTGSQTGRGGLIQGPRTSVDDAGKRAMQAGAPNSVNDSDLQIFGAPGQQNRGASALELLSDPMGVDFRPYLVRVLAAVRRNWFLVLPEGARMGQRGRTVVQFSIAKNGSVPKLVIHMPSGSEPLDRAAVAGISASNPFPPLPNEYKGDVLRLQLVFSYNMPGATR